MAGDDTEVGVRFDDLTAGGTAAFAGRGLLHVMVAHEVDAVVGVLDAVDAEAAAGRWCAGFVTYDAASAFDPTLVVPGERGRLPLAWFAVFEGVEEVEALDPPAAAPPQWDLDLGPAEHARAVAAVKAHIARGDTYQTNLTGRLRSTVTDPLGLYAQLVHAHRPGLACLVDTGDHVVASASPELLFDRRGEAVECRPMKGTARRGRWPVEDADARNHLLASAKDRAENVMIVDLIRNDLGRVCEYGSIHVDRLFEVEPYPTVWQLTSTVTGRLRPATTLVDLFRALFPCGSVTGAPKRRTMEIVRVLEQSARGLYCGAIGWVGPGGRARFSVAIRTAVVERATGAAEYGSGGGIVWDSDPAGEWSELAAKADALTAPAGFELVETLRGEQHLDRHLRRMRASARRFGFPFDEDVARTLVQRVGDDLRVRLVLGRDGQLRVETAEAPAPSEQPIRLAVDEERVDPADHLLFHKTTERGAYDRRRVRHPGADDVVLVNIRGEVTEATIANLAFRTDGRWWTPPLSCGLLPGIGREVALEDGRLAERVLHVDDLRHVDGLALISSLRGWRPAALIG